MSSPTTERPASRWGGFALLGALLVGAASVFVVFVLTLDVHHDTGFARDDSGVLKHVRYHSSSRLVDGARALVQLGNVNTLIVIAVVIGFVLLLRGLHPILCAAPLASLLVAGGLVDIMKTAIARSGPGAQFPFDASAHGSFPSGHSADSMSLCIGLAIVLVAVLVRRPAERVAVFGFALALSGAVGASTLVLGVHWPTDVVAGWAIGLGTAIAVGTLAVLVTHDRPLRFAAVLSRPRS